MFPPFVGLECLISFNILAPIPVALVMIAAGKEAKLLKGVERNPFTISETYA